jgi:DNA-binding MarR family transcriptional regulator
VFGSGYDPRTAANLAAVWVSRPVGGTLVSTPQSLISRSVVIGHMEESPTGMGRSPDDSPHQGEADESTADRRAEAGNTERERRSAAESVEHELVMLFRRARNFSTLVASQVHPDLDPASYSLLLMVDDAGSLRGMDVADRTGLDKSTVSRQIATLVALDLLERVQDPDDGRARRIQLSELGRARLADVRRQRRAHLRAEFANWSTPDLQDLARLLARLNRMISA